MAKHTPFNHGKKRTIPQLLATVIERKVRGLSGMLGNASSALGDRKSDVNRAVDGATRNRRGRKR